MLEMLTQFDEKTYEEGLREEGRAEGRAEERVNTERERTERIKAQEELARYKSKYGELR